MAQRVPALRLVAPLVTATAPSTTTTTASAPATDQPVPGISPTQPQRAEAMPYYTSAGVATQYPTPWTHPPTQQEVVAHNLIQQRVATTAAQLVTQQQMDPDVALSVAKKFFGAPNIETGAGYETGPEEGPPWMLIGAGVLAIGAAVYFFTR